MGGFVFVEIGVVGKYRLLIEVRSCRSFVGSSRAVLPNIGCFYNTNPSII